MLQTPSPHRALVHALFLGSGATALVYQIAWVRSLSLVLGAGFEALSIVLAAFMAGLALGGLYLGRRSESFARPLRVYGLLELGIAGAALALPLLLDGVHGLYIARASRVEAAVSPGWMLNGLRVGLSFAVLVVPTFLMGGTLPVLVAALVRGRAELRPRLARLYAVNTIGAVIGALAAGFVLLPTLGMWRTQGVAVLVNFAIGVAALVVDRRWPSEGASRAALEPPTPRPATGVGTSLRAGEVPTLRLVFWGTALFGFGALALEVLWTRTLAIVVGSNVYALTIMLAAFLCGIALGSAIHGARPRRAHEGWNAALLGAALALATLLSSLAIPRLPEISLRLRLWLGGDVVGVDTAAILATSFVVMLVPCMLQGMAFPLAGEARARLLSAGGRSVGDLVAVNTLGSIAGALVAGFVLIPEIGLQRGLLVVSALYATYALVVAGAMLSWRRERTRAFLRPAVVGAIALVWLGAASVPAWDQRSIAAFGNNSEDLARAVVRDGLAGALRGTSVLYHRSGRGSTVSVVERPGGIRGLLIDGKAVASDADSDLRHELLLGHLPVLLHPAPRDVLVVGLGAGVTLGGVTSHPEVRSISVVEIEPAVVPAAVFFSHVHGDALHDPRVRIRIQDGRNHLLTTTRRFDVITADPIHPWARGASYLFTREYYQLARSRLRAGGVMCQWLPLYELAPDDVRAVVGSFVDVFPHATLWHTAYDAVLVGSASPLRIDLADWQRRLAGPAARASLARAGLADPLALLAEFGTDADGMRQLAAGAVRNTDDNLLLEFRSPWSMGRERVQENLRMLRSFEADPLSLVASPQPLFRDRAEAARRIREYAEAEADIAAALLERPRSASIARLREIAARVPGHGRIRRVLARQLRLAGRESLARGGIEAAIAAFREAVALSPSDWRPRVDLGWALHRQAGRPEEAEEVLVEAVGLAPGAVPVRVELAYLLQAQGRPGEAIPHLRAALRGRPGSPELMNDLAWLLATRPDAGAAERREALELAERAAAITHRRDPAVLDTLAVCHAAAGQLEAARAATRDALAVAQASGSPLVPHLQERRDAYARGHFWLDGGSASLTLRVREASDPPAGPPSLL